MCTPKQPFNQLQPFTIAVVLVGGIVIFCTKVIIVVVVYYRVTVDLWLKYWIIIYWLKYWLIRGLWVQIPAWESCWLAFEQSPELSTAELYKNRVIDLSCSGWINSADNGWADGFVLPATIFYSLINFSGYCEMFSVPSHSGLLWGPLKRHHTEAQGHHGAPK